MKKYFICIVLTVSLLNLYCISSFAEVSQQAQPSRPIPLPVAPSMGNTEGEVIDKSSEKDETLWIKVRDDIFDQTLKIKVHSENIPVIKENKAASFKDIKVGDMVNVVFSQSGKEISAHFISILTKEDISPSKN